MKETLIIVSLVLALLGGGVLGYCVGTINMQEDAIAQGVAVWQPYTSDRFVAYSNGDARQRSFEFRWLPPCNQ